MPIIPWSTFPPTENREGGDEKEVHYNKEITCIHYSTIGPVNESLEAQSQRVDELESVHGRRESVVGAGVESPHSTPLFAPVSAWSHKSPCIEMGLLVQL